MYFHKNSAASINKHFLGSQWALQIAFIYPQWVDVGTSKISAFWKLTLSRTNWFVYPSVVKCNFFNKFELQTGLDARPVVLCKQSIIRIISNFFPFKCTISVFDYIEEYKADLSCYKRYISLSLSLFLALSLSHVCVCTLWVMWASSIAVIWAFGLLCACVNRGALALWLISKLPIS